MSMNKIMPKRVVHTRRSTDVVSYAVEALKKKRDRQLKKSAQGSMSRIWLRILNLCFPAEKLTKTKKEENVRIKRLSAAQNKQLTEILTKVKLEMTDDHKRGFVKFVEEMSEDDFKSMSQLQQMQSYADSISRTPPLEGEAVEMTLGELQAIKMTATLDDIVGTYWDADKGRYVKGPEEEPDEGIDPVAFEGKEYGVGEKTGRVYLEVNDKDLFQGFIGVGKFKAMSRT
jgi:hypothetical protein